ncbi:Aste57867_12183 [Aphanomyces stellatus]|uniref:Aste57867_12183 protein n=1 Tax=Aphanomyces stellatus TaxID=120398 RepID=A0A485KVB8_9STRA|nr:hypothetical protein As57867_012138 [Aphanomyces stellatus]VFT89037.1 Aste57867_12183 [Aphanomyces stellatus]
MMQLTPADKRRAEALRFRQRRAAQKDQHKRLEEQLRTLQAEIEHLKKCPPPPKTRENPYHVAAQVLFKYNQSLRDDVKRQTTLAKLLSSWVASQYPIPALPKRASWIESTLLAHPAARRQGFQWLSERVYHNAVAAMPHHPFGSRVDDRWRFDLHTCNDDVEGMTLGCTESHAQHTFFANVSDVADAVWACQCQGNYLRTYPCSNLSPGVLEQVQRHLVYFCVAFEGIGAHVRRIMSLFEDDHRMLITFALVAEDECFPIETNEMRSHGFGWISLERVAATITLMRYSLYLFAPVTAHGVASLEEIGQLYGLSSAGTCHREAYIERIRTMAEATFEQGNKRAVEYLAHRLEQVDMM